jgi:hypothetical protein
MSDRQRRAYAIGPRAGRRDLCFPRRLAYNRAIELVVPHIGTLNEGSLHAALKERYARPGDELEVPLDGFVIDIRRPGLLVEIQTSSLGALGPKLDRLLAEHRMLLVHPIAIETYLRRPGKPNRKSPKRGSIYSIFEQLVSIPTLLDHPNLTLDVVLASVILEQKPDPRARRGRGGYRTLDRQLRDVLAVQHFRTPADLAALLPAELPPRFTTADLAATAGISRQLAQQMAFCLRALELLVDLGRTRAGIHYARSERLRRAT